MNFEYLVKTKEAYNEKNLTENEKEFIAGMRFVLDNVVDFFVSNYFIGEPKNTIAKIEEELVTEAIEVLKEYIESDIYAAIVSLIDSHEDNENLS